MLEHDARVRSAIAQNIARFSFRDESSAQELRDLFHASGTIAVCWYSGPIDGFIDASRSMVPASHSYGLPRIEVRGGRALSEVDVAMRWRSQLGACEADLTSYARFFDRYVHCDDGRWRVLERTAIYQHDRLDPVRPSLRFRLLYRRARLDRYPPECRHLAFALERQGMRLAHVIAAHSAEETALKSAAARWLAACDALEPPRAEPVSVVRV